MVTTCAVCRLSDGLVMNTVMASPNDPPPDGCQLVEIMTGQMCDIGWCYIGGEFRGPRRYAVYSNVAGEVYYFVSASYVSPVPVVPTGYGVVELQPDDPCAMGWVWDGTKFNPPTA